jgi:catalase
MKETLEGRTVGILVADGSDAGQLAKLTAQIQKAGARSMLVAPKVGGVLLSNGTKAAADGQLQGSPSVIFDAVVVLLSKGGVKSLLGEAAAVQWVMDAYGHLKAIGFNADAKPLLDKAGIEPDEGVVALSAGFVRAAARRYWAREAKLRTLA